MAKILLIHGAWHGAWCWNKLIPELQALGHEARAIDLPGHGSNNKPLQDINLTAYADRVVEELNTYDEPVILLGHSMGGMVITAAAERCPEKISSLIYLTAFIPKNHQALFHIEENNPKPRIPPNLIPSEDGISATVAEDKIKELFYHDCTDEDLAFAAANLTPQALAPLGDPITLSKENFGSIKRYYIECTEDGAICIELQREMYENSPCEKVTSLASSHSPFLSMPKELATAISSF